ncbi:MAG TPA: DUF92 domain-containing protein [Natrialbaceae archaeon]|nr:DUF92 domain-containing protein [Natrialbaceae archaeon]
MTSTVRRAGAFAAIATLSLAAPAFRRAAADLATPSLEWGGAATFGLVALLAFVVDEDTVGFELFARPGDREDGRLYGLLGFSLAATGLGVLTVYGEFPTETFVGTVLLLGYGNLAAQYTKARGRNPVIWSVAFAIVGAIAAFVGQVVAAGILAERGDVVNAMTAQVPTFVFLATSGALLGALLRAVLFERDDPLVMLSVGLLLWLLVELAADVGVTEIAIALGVTIALGYVSYALETASAPGMVTGVLLALLTIVLGGYGWFVILITFFGIGGLASKFRYDQKEQRGIAEDNEGARGSGNVLGNSTVALGAVLAHAASETGLLGMEATLSPLFAAAFAGSIATAMADTLSSEIGGLYDRPRLITTLEVVEPGTDGGVTWQGELAGVAGALLVALIAVGLTSTTPLEGAVVVVAGVAGMTMDSLLGATLEGSYLGNQGVNFLATLTGGVVALGLVVLL